ncbi:unnamed protein product [Clonostachys rosea f. rosea IK726]|uniref:Uncharacterized protein n=1 Tax=Clonostachys rosea f. rosea IK726 TaxID=1349383 RepID=A0ACA9UFK5_BIOOC|nr:unnamed protein product [Clonostachys rosea f. rosea IK726]
MIYYTEISSQAIGFPPTAPASPLRQDDSLDASIGKDPLPLSALIKPLNFETLHFASNATTQEVPLNAKPTSIIPSTQRAIVTPVMGKTLNMTVKEVKDATFSTGPQPGYPKFDHIAGHEGIGVVVQCQDDSLLHQTVGVRYLGVTCGTCTYCHQGLLTSCPEQLNAPKQISGTFQQYATVPVSCLIRLPQHILGRSVNLGSLCAALCSGSAALMALKSAHVATGKVVVVSGVAGAIGHLTAAMARQIYGAKAIGIDFGWKNDILRKKHHGEIADILLDVPEDTHGEAWVEFTTALTRSCMRLRHDKGTERAADSLIICASKESAFKQMEDYICDGGRIVCSGVPKGLSVSLSIHDLVERKLHLTGTLMGGHDVALEVMDYISSGRIRPVIVERKIENVPEILEQIVDCKGIGKMVVNMHN